jgi:hypothetical protein
MTWILSFLLILALFPAFNIGGSGDALARLVGQGRAATPPPPASPSPAPAPSSGSSPAPAPAPGNPVTSNPCQPADAAAYFPYQQGTKATYAGLGNEFASFKVDVIGQGGNKVEWRKDNGGTVMAEVFQVAPQQVTRIYREGEVYDLNPRLNNPPNQSEIILKGPIQVGTQWTAGNTTFTIQSINATVQALGSQTLTCVVKVNAQAPGGVTETYFHKQYGMVLSIFNPGPNQVESRLATFTP